MNKCFLTGNLCKDNDVRIIQGTNKKVIRNSIAVKREFKNKNGEYESDFINIVVYEPSANFMDQYIRKGDKVGITGRWQHRHYTNNYGTETYVDECVADSIELLAKPQRKSSDQYEPEPTTDNNPFAIEDDDLSDDLPF